MNVHFVDSTSGGKYLEKIYIGTIFLIEDKKSITSI